MVKYLKLNVLSVEKYSTRAHATQVTTAVKDFPG